MARALPKARRSPRRQAGADTEPPASEVAAEGKATDVLAQDAGAWPTE